MRGVKIAVDTPYEARRIKTRQSEGRLWVGLGEGPSEVIKTEAPTKAGRGREGTKVCFVQHPGVFQRKGMVSVEKNVSCTGQ